jgi:import inner membrane translocase subunit TIM22
MGDAPPPEDAPPAPLPPAPLPPAPPVPSWPPPKRERKTYAAVELPSPDAMAAEDGMNNCAVRTIMSGVMGMGLGVVFGVFMGTMDSAGVRGEGQGGGGAVERQKKWGPPQLTPRPPHPPSLLQPGLDGTGAVAEKQTARQVMRQMAATAKSRSVSYAKGFGAMGALFAGSECVIEKARAKHDIMNAVYAGCAAGGALAAGAGVKAACVGCASFAAFSAFIEKVMATND